MKTQKNTILFSAIFLLTTITLTFCISDNDQEKVGKDTGKGSISDQITTQIPEGANRVYYAGENMEESVRANVLGVNQILYYDVYEPTTTPIGITFLHIHGGGYNVGDAGGNVESKRMEYLASKGCWAIALEYRRGFTLGGNKAIANEKKDKGLNLSQEDKDNFYKIIEMSLEDIKEAIEHVDKKGRKKFKYPAKYVVAGTSAGGSLASRATITNPDMNENIIGVIVGFGTHEWNEPVNKPVGKYDIPVIIQGGMLDITSPFFNNNPWFDKAMPIAKGLWELYQEMDSVGYQVRLLVSAQAGHGFGAYKSEFHNRLAGHYMSSAEWFLEVDNGKKSENYIEYKFTKKDPLNPHINPGLVINTLDSPEFKYEPLHSFLEKGGYPKDFIKQFNLQ